MRNHTVPKTYAPKVPHDHDDKVSQSLQSAVVVMVDLQLQAKQAQWNVVGSNFRSLSVQLEDLVDMARGAADTFAERMRALGGYADARVAVVAATSTLLPARDGAQSSEQVARAVSTRLHLVSEILRSARVEVETWDSPTANMLTQTLVAVEKHAWMLEAEITPSRQVAT